MINPIAGDRPRMEHVIKSCQQLIKGEGLPKVVVQCIPGEEEEDDDNAEDGVDVSEKKKKKKKKKKAAASEI